MAASLQTIRAAIRGYLLTHSWREFNAATPFELGYLGTIHPRGAVEDGESVTLRFDLCEPDGTVRRLTKGARRDGSAIVWDGPLVEVDPAPEPVDGWPHIPR